MKRFSPRNMSYYVGHPELFIAELKAKLSDGEFEALFQHYKNRINADTTASALREAARRLELEQAH